MAVIPVHLEGSRTWPRSTTIPTAVRPVKCSACCEKPAIRAEVIEYLKTPPTRAELKALLTQMGMTPRQLLRRRGTPFDELGWTTRRKPTNN